jgi:hypothetical protein
VVFGFGSLVFGFWSLAFGNYELPITNYDLQRTTNYEQLTKTTDHRPKTQLSLILRYHRAKTKKPDAAQTPGKGGLMREEFMKNYLTGLSLA